MLVLRARRLEWLDVVPAGLGTTLAVVALLLPTVLLMSRSLRKQSRRVR